MKAAGGCPAEKKSGKGKNVNMKKICALLLVIGLLATQCMALAEEAGGAEFDHLTVGNPTPMRGDFFAGMWGNVSSDIDVRTLLHGYNLVYWNGEQGLFTVDPTVVTGIAVMSNEAGDKSFVMVLADDLYYSDGSKITAWDYAFSYLLSISPEISKLGGSPARKEHLLGYQEYIDGSTKTLKGVRVLADDTIMVTISHEYLPFFYEMGLLLCNPYPIKEIAPGVVVKDDGEGVYLAGKNGELNAPFSADLLMKTILDPDTGYMSHPSVVSGPYTLVSWDGKSVELEANPYYKGDAEGDLPTIQKLTYTLAEYDSMMDKLQNGEFDLLNKVMRADAIASGLNAAGDGAYAFSNYPRAGLGFIGFACEKDTVKSAAVRQAIAWCMDRDRITADYTGSFGVRTDGYYGLGQWMYGIIAGTTQPPVDPPEDENDKAAMAAYNETLAAYDALNMDALTVYGVDTDKAAALLDADGWTLNEKGIREKDGVVLDLKLIYSEETKIEDTFNANLIPNLEKVGIKLTMDPAGIEELLGQWYKQKERNADMLFLATNFDIVFDPSVNFQEGKEGEPNWAYTSLSDKELFADALAMRTTEPGDVLGYMQHWLSFQDRFNEVLPMLPVYSNIYFDFYTSALHDYAITENITWGQAILGATLSDETPVEENAESEETFGD